MNKIKVLITSKNLGLNGISTVIMNYCRNIDLSKFEITVMSGLPINKSYKKELENLNIDLIELTDKDESVKKYYKNMYKKVKSNYYDIIHSHGNSSTLSIEMFIGFLKKIKVRISHSHNTSSKSLLVHKLLNPFLKIFCTEKFACSKKAGEWLFKKSNYKIIPNGFYIDRYLFSEENRKKIRKKLKLNETDYLIGHIGSFDNVKNQHFLIDMMKKMVNEKSNIYLILVGSGPDFEDIKKHVDLNGLKNNIILYGEVNNTFELYSAMDLFLLPSKYEGLPLTLLEAQVNGLHALVSKNVSKEVDITKNIEFLSIDDSYDIWIKSIKKQINKPRKEINIKDRKIQKYNIKNNVKEIEKIYTNLVN